MKTLTKVQVIEFLKNELESGNNIVTCSDGQGASGLDDSNCDITGELEDMDFNGFVKDPLNDFFPYCEDWGVYGEDWAIYEFQESNEGNPLKYQVAVY